MNIKELYYCKDKRYIFIICSIAFLYAFAYLIVAVNVGGAWTSDAQLHARIMEAWKDGHNPLIEKEFFGNRFFYPPAFHFTLSLIPLDTYTIFGLLQVLLFPCILIIMYWFTQKFYGGYVGVVAVCLVISGFAFWDRPSQPIPNSIDVLLIPLVFYSYLSRRGTPFVLVSVYLIYNHLLYPMFPLGVLFVHVLFRRRDFLKNYLIIGVLCLPLFYLYIPYIPDMLSFPQTNEYRVPQYIRFVANPLWGVAYLGYPLFLVGLFSIYHFLQKNKKETEWVLILWALSFIPLLIKFPHRGITYIAQPLAILGAVTIKERGGGNLVLGVLLVVAFIYFIAQMSYLFSDLRVPIILACRWLLIGWT